jgi:hypothetical protein
MLESLRRKSKVETLGVPFGHSKIQNKNIEVSAAGEELLEQK